jgi:dihydrofolate reductase
MRIFNQLQQKERAVMGKVMYDISMSLDGFITAANVRPEAGLGDGGERLHEWAFSSDDPRNRELLAKGASLGAIITGRHNYDLSVPYWHADGPTGAARVPTVVVSHSVPSRHTRWRGVYFRQWD